MISGINQQVISRASDAVGARAASNYAVAVDAGAEGTTLARLQR